jgi:hypothetical protein
MIFICDLHIAQTTICTTQIIMNGVNEILNYRNGNFYDPVSNRPYTDARTLNFLNRIRNRSIRANHNRFIRSVETIPDAALNTAFTNARRPPGMNFLFDREMLNSYNSTMNNRPVDISDRDMLRSFNRTMRNRHRANRNIAPVRRRRREPRGSRLRRSRRVRV